MTQRILLLLILLSVHGIPQMKQILYQNGKIYTGNGKAKFVECVVAQGNLITYAGDLKGARSLLVKDHEVVDLAGALMLPGLSDNHVHFVSGGEYLGGLDLRPAKSTAEFKDRLRQYIAGKGKGEWITGGDWDHEAWEVKYLPTKEMIDDISPDNPVLISRFDGHIALANSLALKMAGIDATTPQPSGGEIKKNSKGEPTGVLVDLAMSLVSKLIPPASEKENEASLKRALNEAARLGLTMVHDITYKNDLKVYQKFERNNDLTCRIYTRLPIAEYRNLSNLGIENGFGSDMLKVGSLKAFADGSLGAASAWFFEGYAHDPGNKGLPMDIITNDSLRKWAFEADRAGLQLSIHAIGDRANSYILEMFAEIVSKNPKRDRRFRIEHAQHLRLEDIPKFKQYGVIASAQPYHCIDDGVWAHKRLGHERISSSYRFADLLKEGAHLCFGSDWSVAPLNPFLGIYAAVTRRTLDGKNPDGWIPDQKISVEDAVKGYTIANAYAAFMEDKLGTIEPGKYADLTVIDRDIFTIDPELIKETKVLRTVVNGVTVYKK